MASKSKVRSVVKTKLASSAAKFKTSGKTAKHRGGGKGKSNAWRAYTGVSNDPIPF
jgi:hypothetical protein